MKDISSAWGVLHHHDPVLHTDGTRVFLHDDDRQRQDSIAERLAKEWNMRLLYVGDLSFVDFLGIRDERPVRWIELISRNYSYEQLMSYGGVFLKRQTWEAMRSLADAPLSVLWEGAYIVYDLRDGLYYNNIENIEDSPTVAYDPRGAVNDTEAAINVKNLTRMAA